MPAIAIQALLALGVVSSYASARCTWGNSDPSKPFSSTETECCDGSLGDVLRNAISRNPNKKLGDIAKAAQKTIQERLGDSFEVIASAANFAFASHYHGTYSCKIRTRKGFFMLYKTPVQIEIVQKVANLQYDVTNVEQENWLSSIDADEPLGSDREKNVRGNFRDRRQEPTAGEDRSVQPPLDKITEFPNKFAEVDPDEDVVQIAQLRALQLDTEAEESEATTPFPSDDVLSHQVAADTRALTDTGTGSAANASRRFIIAHGDIEGPHPIARIIKNGRPGDKIPDGSSCGGSGSLCCDGQLAATARDAYNQMATAPSFDDDSIGSLSRAIQKRLQLRYSKSYEVIVSKADFEFKSHQVGDRICKFKYKKFNMIVYATPVQYDITNTAQEQILADVSNRDPLGSADSKLPDEAPEMTPLKLNGETGENGLNGLPMGSHCTDVRTGSRCCSGPVFNAMQQGYEAVRSRENFNPYNLRAISREIQYHVEEAIGTSAEVLVSRNDFAQATYLEDDNTCKYRVDEYTILAYATPVPYPPHTDTGDPDLGEAKSFSCPSGLSRLNGDVCCDGGVAYEMEKAVQSNPNTNNRFDKSQAQRIAQLIMETEQRRHNTVFDVIVSKGDFTLSTHRFNQRSCKVDVMGYSVLAYQVSTALPPPGDFILTPGNVVPAEQPFLVNPQLNPFQPGPQQFLQPQLQPPLQPLQPAVFQPANAIQTVVLPRPPPIVPFRAEAAGGGFACFSTDTWLTTPKGKRRMDQVSVGDYVLTANLTSTYFTPITMWMHREPEINHEFVTVMTDYGKMLALTRRHLIFRNKCDEDYEEQVNVLPRNKAAVYAQDLEVGDCVMLLYKGKFRQQRIQEVEITKRKGIFAPLTANGRIIVNDMLASCYSDVKQITLQNSYFLLISKLQQKLKLLLGDYFHNKVTLPHGAAISFDMLRLVLPSLS